LVLLEQDSTPFSPQEFWYRPDYPCARFIDTALLRACRLVYIETWNIPLLDVTYRRWLGSGQRMCPRREFSLNNGRQAFDSTINDLRAGSWWPCTRELPAYQQRISPKPRPSLLSNVCCPRIGNEAMYRVPTLCLEA
jgi:hypothetical protein